MKRITARLPMMALLVGLLTPTPVAADSIVIGWPPDPNTGNGAPFGIDFPGPIYQQVYAAELFPSLFEIQAISFFNTQIKEHVPADDPFIGIQPAQYEFRLSTTAQPVNELSVDVAENVGGDDALFAKVFLAGRVLGDELTITGVHFIYDPTQGNLLLQVIKSEAQPCGCSLYFDARHGSFGTDSSRAAPGLDESGWASYGLVTRFEGNGNPPPIPEPSTGALIGGGLAAAILALRRGQSVQRRTAS